MFYNVSPIVVGEDN